MVFYKIEAKRIVNDDEKRDNSRQERRTLATEFCEKSEHLYQKSGQQNMVFTVSFGEKVVVLCAVAKKYEDLKEQVKQYIQLLPFEGSVK